jgi:hypothetical protein
MRIARQGFDLWGNNNHYGCLGVDHQRATDKMVVSSSTGAYLMEIREEHQRNPVADEVGALIAVTRPIVNGVLQSIRTEMITAIGRQRENLPLKLLGRLRKQGDGDTGIAFEYAVHDAIKRGEPAVVARIKEALAKCRIGGDVASILFAVEKAGAKQLISTNIELITDESRILSGNVGQPAKLKRYLNTLAAAFRRANVRAYLPQSIRGLWKADLFLGSSGPDHWVGTSVKIVPSHLEGAAGLRVGIIPTQSGRDDRIRMDDQRNLVVCPLPHDYSFMQVFYEGLRIVQALCSTDFEMPNEVLLASPVHREVARMWAERRELPVVDVLLAAQVFAQPELLVTQDATAASVSFQSQHAPDTSTVISPFPRLHDST